MAATATLKAKLTLDDSAFKAGIRRAKDAAVAFGKAAMRAGVVGMTGGMVAAGAAATRLAKSTAEMSDNLLKMSRMTGLSVSEVFMLGEAFKLADVSADSMGAKLAKMEATIYAAAKGNEKLAQSFSDIGLSAASLEKMGGADAFIAIGRALTKLPGMQQQAAALKLFGKSGGDFLAVFKEMEGMDLGKLRQQGMIFQQNADSIDEAGDNVTKFSTALAALAAGPLGSIAGWFTKMAQFDFANFAKTAGVYLGSVAEDFTGRFIEAFGNAVRYVAAALKFAFSSVAVGFYNEIKEILDNLGLGDGMTFKQSKSFARTLAETDNPISRFGGKMRKDAAQRVAELEMEQDREIGGRNRPTKSTPLSWFQKRLQQASGRLGATGLAAAGGEWSETVKKGEYKSGLQTGSLSSGPMAVNFRMGRKKAEKDKEGVDKTNDLLAGANKRLDELNDKFE